VLWLIYFCKNPLVIIIITITKYFSWIKSEDCMRKEGPLTQSVSCKCKPHHGIVIWVYKASEFNRGVRPRVDNGTRNSRVKDAVLSHLMGLPVDRTEPFHGAFDNGRPSIRRDRGRRLAREQGLRGVLSLFTHDTEVLDTWLP